MIKAFCFWVMVLMMSTSTFGQNDDNPYDLDLISSEAEYAAYLKDYSHQQLVNLRYFDSSLVFDIRYATPNNFTNKVVYPSAGAYLALPAAMALKQVQDSLRKLGIGIKVFDGYRPYRATLDFWNLVQNKDYVASPRQGSRHNRGCAVDLTLVWLDTGNELAMPTAYDAFEEQAHPDYDDLEKHVLYNRNFLINIMRKFGFSVFHTEWWHYDFDGWEAFPLLNLTFDELENLNKK